MSTPQPPLGNPDHPQIPQGYELAKRKKPWFKRVGCIVPLAILAIIIIVVAVSTSGESDSGSSSSNDTSSNSNDSSAGSDNQKAADSPAPLGETVSMEKVDVTASNLRPVADAMGQYLCADVDFQVTSDSDSVTLNGMMDWKLTDPNGVTATQTVGGETNYDSVEVGPGGNKSGTVCFDSEGAPGDYTLTFEEGLSFSSEKATWSAQL